MSGSEHISVEELALYALEAGSSAEDALMLSHLQQCAECRRQLAEMRGETALLGLAAPSVALPAGTRQRFLDRIAQNDSTTIAAPAKPARVLLLPRLAWAIAAALLIVIGLQQMKIAQVNMKLQSTAEQVATLEQSSARAQQVLDALTSHTAQHVLLTANRAAVLPSGRAVYVAKSGSLIFQANDLKQIAADQIYELWVVPVHGKPMPAGLFRPDAAGSASVVLPPLPSGLEAKAFGVTLEKSAGSETPTLPMVLSGAVGANSGE